MPKIVHFSPPKVTATSPKKPPVLGVFFFLEVCLHFLSYINHQQQKICFRGIEWGKKTWKFLAVVQARN